MPKSIYLTDEAYQQIVEAAIKCGFRVSRGRGSQLALFVVEAANNSVQRTLTGNPIFIHRIKCWHCGGDIDIPESRR